MPTHRSWCELGKCGQVNTSEWMLFCWLICVGTECWKCIILHFLAHYFETATFRSVNQYSSSHAVMGLGSKYHDTGDRFSSCYPVKVMCLFPITTRISSAKQWIQWVISITFITFSLKLKCSDWVIHKPERLSVNLVTPFIIFSYFKSLAQNIKMI